MSITIAVAINKLAAAKAADNKSTIPALARFSRKDGIFVPSTGKKYREEIEKMGVSLDTFDAHCLNVKGLYFDALKLANGKTNSGVPLTAEQERAVRNMFYSDLDSTVKGMFGDDFTAAQVFSDTYGTFVHAAISQVKAYLAAENGVAVSPVSLAKFARWAEQAIVAEGCKVSMMSSAERDKIVKVRRLSAKIVKLEKSLAEANAAIDANVENIRKAKDEKAKAKLEKAAIGLAKNRDEIAESLKAAKAKLETAKSLKTDFNGDELLFVANVQ